MRKLIAKAIKGKRKLAAKTETMTITVRVPIDMTRREARATVRRMIDNAAGFKVKVITGEQRPTPNWLLDAAIDALAEKQERDKARRPDGVYFGDKANG